MSRPFTAVLNKNLGFMIALHPSQTVPVGVYRKELKYVVILFVLLLFSILLTFDINEHCENVEECVHFLVTYLFSCKSLLIKSSAFISFACALETNSSSPWALGFCFRVILIVLLQNEQLLVLTKILSAQHVISFFCHSC